MFCYVCFARRFRITLRYLPAASIVAALFPLAPLPMAEAKPKLTFFQQFSRFLLVFAGVYLLLTLLFPAPRAAADGELALAWGTEQLGYGKPAVLALANGTDAPVWVGQICSSEISVTHDGDIISAPRTLVADCTAAATLQPGEGVRLPLDAWQGLLTKPGFYRADVVVQTGATEAEAAAVDFKATFTRSEQGILGWAWEQLIERPIFNTLIFFVQELPGHTLAGGVVLLTLLIRLILLYPSHRALKSSRKMQLLQPRLQELQKQYADNREKQAMETMKLFKENNVSPFAAFLPILLQLPVLIALYTVFLQGITPAMAHLTYPFLQSFDISLINHQLWMLDLREKGTWYLAGIVALLQLGQAALAMARIKKQPKKQWGPDEKPSNGEIFAESMRSASTVMLYIMPLLVLFFTLQLPAAVGLYWGVSTLVGVVQQWWVNRETQTVVVK